jgi:hypothetical protein
MDSMEFEPRQQKGMYTYTSKSSRPAVGHTQPLIQLVLGVLSSGYSGWGLKFTNHLPAILGFRMSGVTLSGYSFMTCVGTIYLSYLYLVTYIVTTVS